MDIKVERKGELFYVFIEDEKSISRHKVTLGKKDYERLTKGVISEEELIRQSFLFLLERESKEMILTSFDLMDISKYFPEYENEIKKRL